ncbi:hypothetical protein SDC9_152487 [bioreactor metagenome]|uniref:Uncharacterized protein n=1 Tax=bioreactor metagenome TaxID=1076179 RepID=A0A645ETS0_9ZZZZ
MAVRHHDHAAGVGIALVRHHLVADPLIDLHQAGDALFSGELAELFLVLRLPDGGGGGVMIQEDQHVFGVLDLDAAHLPE